MIPITRSKSFNELPSYSKTLRSCSRSWPELRHLSKQIAPVIISESQKTICSRIGHGICDALRSVVERVVGIVKTIFFGLYDFGSEFIGFFSSASPSYSEYRKSEMDPEQIKEAISKIQKQKETLDKEEQLLQTSIQRVADSSGLFRCKREYDGLLKKRVFLAAEWNLIKDSNLARLRKEGSGALEELVQKLSKSLYTTSSPAFVEIVKKVHQWLPSFYAKHSKELTIQQYVEYQSLGDLISSSSYRKEHLELIERAQKLFQETTKAVGLPNSTSTTCWMNSSLQLLVALQNEILSGVPVPKRPDEPLEDYESRQLLLTGLRHFILARYTGNVGHAAEEILEILKNCTLILAREREELGNRQQDNTLLLDHALQAMGHPVMRHVARVGRERISSGAFGTLLIKIPNHKEGIDLPMALRHEFDNDDERGSISKFQSEKEAPEVLVMEFSRLDMCREAVVKDLTNRFKHLKEHFGDLSDSQINAMIDAGARVGSGKNNTPIRNLDFVNLSSIIGMPNGERSKDPILYGVEAFTCHSGTDSGGHWVAYLKLNGVWHLCDDSHVRPLREDELKERAQKLEQANSVCLRRIYS